MKMDINTQSSIIFFVYLRNIQQAMLSFYALLEAHELTHFYSAHVQYKISVLRMYCLCVFSIRREASFCVEVR